MPETKFYFTVGDYFGTCHNRIARFLLTSEKTLDDVREAYFQIKPKLGVDLETIFDNWNRTDSGYMLQKDINMLTHLGVQFEQEGPEDTGFDAPFVCEVFIHLCNMIDPDLHLERADESIPDFHFYGKDAKGRRIGNIGYGALA